MIVVDPFAIVRLLSMVIVAAAHKYVPSLPAGDASIDVTKRPDIVVDGSKSKKVLGITYRTFEETSKDTIVDLEQKGWWKA